MQEGLVLHRCQNEWAVSLSTNVEGVDVGCGRSILHEHASVSGFVEFLVIHYSSTAVSFCFLTEIILHHIKFLNSPLGI